MKYLISGHPRTRSAWLCALLNAHGSLCFHDAILNKTPLSVDAGIADPGLACLYPEESVAAVRKGARFCILRSDWRQSLATWCGYTIADEVADEWEMNVAMFQRSLGTIALPVEQLEDDHTVKEVMEICTAEPASIELIQIFQGLKVEQHLAKARSGAVPSPFPLAI